MFRNKKEKSISGDKTPQYSDKRKIYWPVLCLLSTVSVIFFLFCNWILVGGKVYFEQIRASQQNNATLFDLINAEVEGVGSLSNAFSFVLPPQLYLVIGGFSIAVGFMMYAKFSFRSNEKIAYGQKGDSRETTLEELKKQYPMIPDREKTFKGYGGLIVAHWKNYHFIDQSNTNSYVAGGTRSGKGQQQVLAMIDNISRGSKKASMVPFDAKGELYAASKDTLEERGYEVHAFNLLNPDEGMSYNPLQFILNHWNNGDPFEAAKETNTLFSMMYNNPDAGENKWVYDGAKNAMSGIALALIEKCLEIGQIQKATLTNVMNMVNELGTMDYKKDKTTTQNVLDEYFDELPMGHSAKARYKQTSFAGDRAKGSVFFTALEGLEPFMDPKLAKMTSRNSLDLTQVGFPKRLKGQLSKQLTKKRIQISFHKNDKNKSLIKKYNVKVKNDGHFSLNFDETSSDDVGVGNKVKDFLKQKLNKEEKPTLQKLENKDLILIKYVDEKTKKVWKVIYEVEFKKKKDENGQYVMRKKKGEEHLPEYEKELTLKRRVNTFPTIQKDLQVSYSNKPTALFIIAPDYDTSNHKIATILITQLYTELARQASLSKPDRCFFRVHFILDEFAQMPAIPDLGTKLSVCLSRNILFHLFVQADNQVEENYGKAAKTIKGNCANQLFINANDEDTIEAFSKAAGHKTGVANSTNNEQQLDPNVSRSRGADQLRVIPPEILSQIGINNQLLIRRVYRTDLKGQRVRPYPIYAADETAIPYAYKYLGKWFDTDKTINDIEIHSDHTFLELNNNVIDMAQFIVNDQERTKYQTKTETDRNKRAILSKWSPESRRLGNLLLEIFNKEENPNRMVAQTRVLLKHYIGGYREPAVEDLTVLDNGALALDVQPMMIEFINQLKIDFPELQYQDVI